MRLLTLAPDFPQALLATVAVRATLILAAAWLLTRLLRGAAASTRHTVWTVGLVSLMLLPLASLALPRWDLPAPAAAPVPAMPMAGLPAPGSTPAALEPAAHDHALMRESAAAPRRGPMLPATMLVAVWLLGAAFGLGRLSAGWAAARRLVRRARPVPGRAEQAVRELSARMDIARDVRVLMSDTLSVPVNCGMLRPVVLLPASAETWSAQRLQVVLLHELAHVRRWDYASLLAMEAVRAVYWLNPLVWLAARAANVELERACDDEVLRAGTQSVDYAEHLYDIAASLAGASAPRGALAMAQPSTLRARVGAILQARMNRSPVRPRAVAGAAAVALLVGVPLASLRLLGEGRDAAEVHSAIRSLGASDGATRAQAAWALGRRRASGAMMPLVSRLRDEDATVRGMAAWALGAVKNREALPALVATLGDPDRSVREMAVLALGALGDLRAVAALASMTDDPDMGVRGVLTHALQQLGGDDAGEVLAAMVQHDTDEHVRDMAGWSLRLTMGARAVPTLLATLRDSSATIRNMAAHNLAELGDARALHPLAAASRYDAAPAVRAAAAWALGSLQDARAAEPLAAVMADPDWHVRVAAAQALGRTPGRPATDALIAATRDPVHQVRLTAVEGLDTRAKL